MADVIQVGFGTNPITILNAGAFESSVRLIQTSPGQSATVTGVQVASLQQAGAVVPNAMVPLFILRGGAGLGSGSTPGSLSVTADLRGFQPFGQFVGLPSVDQLRAQIELLYASYFPQETQGRVVKLPGNITASDGQTLAVCAGTVVDGSIVPPLVLPNGSGLSLSVLGYYERSQSGGVGSLPRFGIEAHG